MTAPPGPIDRSVALRNAYSWFERHSGWAPPDEEWLADWVAEGLSRCPDGCLVAHDGWCDHGLASWWLILSDLDGADGDPATRGSSSH